MVKRYNTHSLCNNNLMLGVIPATLTEHSLIVS